MAGLYRRGVQRNATDPRMQVAASQGAGGAIPRGGSAAMPRQQENDTSKNIQTLGGLLGMMNQQKQAQEDIAPGLAAAEQAQAGVDNLANPANMAFSSAPSADGGWGGVQMGAFGPGTPVSTGDWSGAANGTVPNFAAGAGLELPGMSTAPTGAMTSFGGGIPGAAANTTAQAAGNLQLPEGFNVQGLLDFLPSFNFGGGAGA